MPTAYRYESKLFVKAKNDRVSCQWISGMIQKSQDPENDFYTGKAVILMNISISFQSAETTFQGQGWFFYIECLSVPYTPF